MKNTEELTKYWFVLDLEETILCWVETGVASAMKANCLVGSCHYFSEGIEGSKAGPLCSYAG